MLVFLKKYWHFIIMTILSMAFFLGSSWFNYSVHSYGEGKEADFVKWSSPDETANYIFSKLYAQAGVLTVFEKNNLYAQDIIRPRSVRSDHGNMKPVSFLGLILIYGKIGSVIGYKALPYLTPFFGAVGLFFYYLFVKKLFDKNTGLLAAAVLAAFPPYFYYTSRSMFHNVLFIVLLIIGLYCVLGMARARNKRITAGEENAKAGSQNGGWQTAFNLFKKKFLKIQFNWRPLLYSASAGFFIGLAIITRASELIWVGPLLFFLWVANIKKVGLIKLLLFLGFLGLALLPAAYYNQILYGNFYFGGYGEMNRSILNVAGASAGLVKAIGAVDKTVLQEMFYKIKDNIFFFGFHPRQSWQLFNNYFVKMFAWLFWGGAAGLLFLLANWKNYRYKRWVYIFSYLLISTALVVYYGSWEFYDNPDKNSVTIGNSYTRYWLPVYLGAIPLACYLTVSILKIAYQLIRRNGAQGGGFFSWRFSRDIFILGLAAPAAVFIMLFSLRYTFAGSEEGLIYLAQRQIDAKLEWSRILDLTEHNAVIITRYHDKLFFPERKVIVGLFDDNNMIAQYAKLTAKLPVYYYNFTFPQKDLEYLNSRRLPAFNLKLEPVRQVTGEFTLYRLLAASQSSEAFSAKQ